MSARLRANHRRNHTTAAQPAAKGIEQDNAWSDDRGTTTEGKPLGSTSDLDTDLFSRPLTLREKIPPRATVRKSFFMGESAAAREGNDQLTFWLEKIRSEVF